MPDAPPLDLAGGAFRADASALVGVPAWQRFGRILIEREALAAGRPRGGIGVLTPAELAAVLGRPAADSVDRDQVVEALSPALDAARDAFHREIDGDEAFAVLVSSAKLSELEAAVVAVCAAATTDLDAAALVGVVTGERTAPAVTVGLLERMFGSAAIEVLQAGGILNRAGLVAVDPAGPLALARVELSRGVSSVLFGDASLDPALPLDSAIAFAPYLDEVGVLDDIVLVCSQDRIRATQAAMSAVGGAFLTCSAPTTNAGWRALVCQATVLGVGVIVSVTRPTDATVSELPPLARYWIDRADHLGWAITSPEPLTLESLPRRRWVEIDASEPSITDEEWKAAFGTEPDRRRPTADQLSAVRGLIGSDMSSDDAFRRLASGSLHGIARRVVPKVTWADLILPESHEASLRALVDRYRMRSRVHDDWGLPLYPSPGVVALFSGPSGTGKTTAAEVIAAELGVDMFRVDLSALVSKYIGETEKNLEQIFSAAHAGNYLLLFDEADALFGTRSKVTDAKDRYANMEVSYLLQRLETYDGFVVLTSNFQGNIDPAFMRRVHAAVHFPVPDADDRKRIWERSLAQAPTEELDMDFVATFDLTGGAIRNVALSAAFLAAADDAAVDMPRLLRAISQELTKLGRRATPEQFGRWQELIR